MEDNLTKAKRALMIPKQLCPTGAVVHAMENNSLYLYSACVNMSNPTDIADPNFS